MREAKPGGCQRGGVPTMSDKVLIMSRILSGMFPVSALIGRERGQGHTGKIPETLGKSRKDGKDILLPKQVEAFKQITGVGEK